MCGIVAAAAKRNVLPILLEGLRRLEYRGYDSAGVAVALDGGLERCRSVGKVAVLAGQLDSQNFFSLTGIAHTRWATHGQPTNENAHPHMSGNAVAVVHNGIVENYAELKSQLINQGYTFESETDTEVVAHLFHRELQSQGNSLDALRSLVSLIEGAYSLAIICAENSEAVYIARSGSPLVIGQGLGENYLASDQLALRPVTDQFIFLQDGDYGVITASDIELYDHKHASVKRSSALIKEDVLDADRGTYRHFMLKEIYEQPEVIKRTLEGRIGQSGILLPAFGLTAESIFKSVKAVSIVACGTSYHAGMVAKIWIEELLNIPVNVEIASEYRYSKTIVPQDCLYISVSQSGETADTLAALKKARQLGYLCCYAICNVASSSLVRESDQVLMTHAGPEIGVASTKAFTAQLTAFLLLTAAIGKAKQIDEGGLKVLVDHISSLPQLCQNVLDLDQPLQALSLRFADKHHALFLGRGVHYPVAKEGALKLKEISYVHAEAYPAGELKHGPLALVDVHMPVVAVAPNNEILGKIKSNIEEVKARGGQLYVLADREAGFIDDATTTIIQMPKIPEVLAPLVYSIPLQLLAYHVAIVKGTDVDQPRNLAKSVTVE